MLSLAGISSAGDRVYLSFGVNLGYQVIVVRPAPVYYYAPYERVVIINYGFLVFGLTDYIGKKFTLHYGAVVAGEPRSQEEKEACLRLGERLAQYVAVLYEGRRELIDHIRNFVGKFPW
ncbi:MAG: hypothetical protein QXP16_06320 [Candidatus Bathyarchaeia archaeon]